LKDILERLLAGETDDARLRPDAWRSEHPEAVRQYRVEERRDKADRKLERTQRRPALQLPEAALRLWSRCTLTDDRRPG
jgi:hypothetical protein